MNLDDLGDRLFADVPQAAALLGLDERTVRKAAAAGEIRATRVGAKWMISTAWLREQIGQPAPAAPMPDPAELVDLMAPRVADLLFARFASLFSGRLGDGNGEAA